MLTNEGRIVGSAVASTDTIELNEHGFETDDPILLRAADGGTLSAPLVAGTTYYVKKLTDATFQVAATAGGAAIDLSTDGASMIVTAPLPVDRLLRLYSRWVDDLLPAHAVPLEPDTDGSFPDVIVGVVARLTGKALLNMDGKSSEIVNQAETAAMAMIDRWSKAVPVRDPRITASTNKAVVASAATSSESGWGSGTLP